MHVMHGTVHAVSLKAVRHFDARGFSRLMGRQENPTRGGACPYLGSPSRPPGCTT